METQALPHEEWGEFFDDLSREYEQGQVSAEIRGNGEQDTPIFQNLPLIGIQLNTKGSDAGSITIIAGQDESAAISHTIVGPTEVSVARDADGTVAAIQIDAPDPSQTRIHFLSAI